MTSSDEFRVNGLMLDDRGADALLSGDPTGVPEGWALVARRLDALREPSVAASAPEELLDRMQAVTETRRPRPFVHAVRFRARTAAMALAGLVAALVGFGGLAAANALPSGVQRFVSDTLDHVGISVPSPADGAPSPSNGPHGGSGATGSGSTVPASGKGHNGPGRDTASTTRPATLPGSSSPDSTPGATAPRGSSATAPGQTGVHPDNTNNGNGTSGNNAGGNGNGQGNGKSLTTAGPPSTTGNGAPHPTKP